MKYFKVHRSGQGPNASGSGAPSGAQRMALSFVATHANMFRLKSGRRSTEYVNMNVERDRVICREYTKIHAIFNVNFQYDIYI